MVWKNHLEKNPIQKIEKNSKNQSEIAACKQKTTTDKENFCSNTVFSRYFKIRAKNFHAAKPLAFSLHFLFRRDQNHYSNLTSNENEWADIKKKTAPQYNSNSLNCKKRQITNTIQFLDCNNLVIVLARLTAVITDLGKLFHRKKV